MPCPHCMLPPKDNRPRPRVEDDVRYWRVSSSDREMFRDVGIDVQSPDCTV